MHIFKNNWGFKMHIRFNAILLTAVSGLLLFILPACGPRYKKTNLKPLTTATATYEQTKNNVCLRAKKLSKKETNELFDGRGHYLFKKRGILPVKEYAYCPVQFTIHNESNHQLSLSPEDIALKQQDIEQIVKRLKFNPLWAFTKPVVISTAAFGATLSAVALTLILSGNPELILLLAGDASSFLITATNSIGAAIGIKDAYQASTCNALIKEDVLEKTLTSETFIAPQDHLNKVIFVEENNLKESFGLTLHSNTYQKTHFDVAV